VTETISELLNVEKYLKSSIKSLEDDFSKTENDLKNKLNEEKEKTEKQNKVLLSLKQDICFLLRKDPTCSTEELSNEISLFYTSYTDLNHIISKELNLPEDSSIETILVALQSYFANNASARSTASIENIVLSFNDNNDNSDDDHRFKSKCIKIGKRKK
jgi:hypothetical protein